jgi:hypothetical protein
MSDLHTEQAAVPQSAEYPRRKDWVEPILEVLPLSETELNSSGSGPDGSTGS